jgi:hypothetical protein
VLKSFNGQRGLHVARLVEVRHASNVRYSEVAREGTIGQPSRPAGCSEYAERLKSFRRDRAVTPANQDIDTISLEN